MFDIKKFLAENKVTMYSRLDESPKNPFAKNQHFHTQGSKQLIYVVSFGNSNMTRQAARDFGEASDWTVYHISGRKSKDGSVRASQKSDSFQSNATIEFIVNPRGNKQFLELLKQYYPSAKIVKKYTTSAQDYEY